MPSFGARFRCRVSVPSFDEDYITHARQITNIVLFAVDLLVAKYYRRDGKLTETWTRDGTVFVKTVDNITKSFTATNAWKVFVDKLKD